MCSTSSYSYHTFYCHYIQWRIRGAWPPPLLFEQNEAQRAEKSLFGDQSPPFSQGVDDRYPPSLSEGLDPPLTLTTDTTLTTYTTLTTLTPATTATTLTTHTTLTTLTTATTLTTLTTATTLTTHTTLTTATTLTTHTTLTTATTVTAATTTWGHNSVPRGTTWH